MKPGPGPLVRGSLACAAALTLLVLSGGRRLADAAPPGASAPMDPASAPAAAAAAHPSGAPATGDLDSGRRILSHHCGSCHMPGLPTTKSEALAIFSLADNDWTARMSPKQMCASTRRIHGTSHEPDEVRDYTELVARLLARRGAPPCGA